MFIDSRLGVDRLVGEVTALYSAPKRVIPLSQSGVGVNLHGSQSGNTLYGGSIKQFGTNDRLVRLNSYESAMTDLYADRLNLPKRDLK